MINKSDARLRAKKLLRSGGGKALCKLACFGEWLIFGGWVRELLMIRVLKMHYGSSVRRQWLWACSGEEPHFTDHRASGFKFLFDKESKIGGYGYYRGFFASEMINNGDVVLDIGCGDGFLTSRFYAPRAKRVDAIDIEQDAITTAIRYYKSENIRFIRQDAVSQDFPSSQYDVIIWDGAIGHFPPDAIDLMLSKISKSLGQLGVFCGSESLGFEGSDHLTFFESLNDLGRLLENHFRFVQLRSIQYPVGLFGNTFTRTEAFWRCSNDSVRLHNAAWRHYPNTSRI